jgi:hypothetical protein
MTWLYMEFVLIIITGPSRGKLGRTAAKRLLTLTSLHIGNFNFIHRNYKD